jgi:PQQ-like domain
MRNQPAGAPVVQQCQSNYFIARFISSFFIAISIAGCAKPVRYQPLDTLALPAGSFARLSNGLVDLRLADTDSITRIDVREKSIYIFSASKQVTSLDRKAFKTNFITQINTPGDRLLPPVELADKIVFPTSISLEIYDYTGAFIRSVSLGSPLRSGAAGRGENIYFGADDPQGGRVMAVDLSSDYSIYRWQLLTPGGAITSAPVLYQSILYVGTENGDVYAVNEDRSPVWAIDGGVFKTAGAIIADLKADETGLFVASKDEKLYCLNRSSGKLKWEFFAGAPLGVAPVPVKDMVYQAIPGVGLAAIETNPAGPYIRPARWVYPGALQFLSQDDKYAYMVEPWQDPTDVKKTGKMIVAVDKVTGKKAFESKHTDFSVFGTNVWDSTIYAGYATGQVLALTPVLKAGQIGEIVLAPRTSRISVATSN